jgi:hypothetical protein
VRALRSANALDVEEPFAMAATPDVLSLICDDHVHLAIWRRARPSALDWLALLDWQKVDDIDAVISTSTGSAEIAQLLEEAGYPPAMETDDLAAEIRGLAERFAGIVEDHRLRFRLEVIYTDACRKFHADQVVARLLMTLHGRGTQWIVAGTGGEPHEISPGEVAIFKGRQWTSDVAILHRSPPIAGSGDTHRDGRDRLIP